MSSILFNADEVLGIAEQIERNGAFFYRKAAEVVVDADGRKLLKDLAAWEVGHEQTFVQMRKRLSAEASRPETFDPEGDAAKYLRAFADGHVFNVNAQDPAKFLEGARTLPQILKEALRREHDAIVFFTAMRELVPEMHGRSEVQAVIGEEVQHVFQITRLLCDAEARAGGQTSL